MKGRAAVFFFVFTLAACRLGQPPVQGNDRLPPRRFHIINLGLPRTATMSFRGVFSAYRSEHEFMLSETINALMDFHQGKKNADDLKGFLRDRDQKSLLEVDSAAFLYLAPDIVIETFPDAAYFFSARRCEPWLVSMTDNFVSFHTMVKSGRRMVDLSFFNRYSDFLFGDHDPGTFLDETRLRQALPSLLARVVKVWGKYNVKTLEALFKVKPEKRLVIRTEDFSSSLEKFARLAGVPVASLTPQYSHINKDKNTQRYEKMIGPALLKKLCAPEQSALDAWLAAHPGLLP